MKSVVSPRRRAALAWTPALVVPSLVLAGIVIAPMGAGAVALPEKTPAEVIAMINGSEDLAYTATVSKLANLGLPAIDMGASVMPEGAVPDGAASDGATSEGATSGGAVPVGDQAPVALLSTALEFFSGEHTARISLDPAVGVRVQVYDRLAERNIVVNETEAWLYDSSTDTATRLLVPDAEMIAAALPSNAAATVEQQRERIAAKLPAELSTPAGLAQFVIDELDATSSISLAANVRVANRAAYELVVTPDASDTLVASISLAVDADTGLPLRVTIDAVGQNDPAFSIAITELDLSTPDSALFTFTPPSSATVIEMPPYEPKVDSEAVAPDAGAGVEALEQPTVVQSGWATIVEIPAASMPEQLAETMPVEQFATSVEGGAVVRTALATVFLADDGRVFVGTVPLSALQSAAAR